MYSQDTGTWIKKKTWEKGLDYILFDSTQVNSIQCDLILLRQSQSPSSFYLNQKT